MSASSCTFSDPHPINKIPVLWLEHGDKHYRLDDYDVCQCNFFIFTISTMSAALTTLSPLYAMDLNLYIINLRHNLHKEDRLCLYLPPPPQGRIRDMPQYSDSGS